MQQEPMFPVVVQAVAGENFTVYAYLLDGTIRKVDVLPLIQGGGVFEPLKNPVFFRDALTVLNDTVAWDLSRHHDPTDCIDLDPFTIAECEAVAEERTASEVLAWDPDFTKVTPEEAKHLEEAERNFQNGDVVNHDEIDWD